MLMRLPPDLARVTRPDWVIVSGVGGRRWGEVQHAYEEARADGQPATVIKTGSDRSGGGGAIALRFTADEITVEQFSGGRWQPRLPASVSPPRRVSSPVATAKLPRPRARSSEAGT